MYVITALKKDGTVVCLSKESLTSQTYNYWSTRRSTKYKTVIEAQLAMDEVLKDSVLVHQIKEMYVQNCSDS